jgi:hypothetical protein
MTIRKRVLPVLTIFLLITACGGGKGSLPTFTVGGSVSGLAGTGLVLQNNGGDNVSVSSDGNFVFATRVATGSAYAVTVKTQPSTPSQTCTATDASGTVAAANVSDVVITCVTNTYRVNVTVSGLAGAGLDLEDNGADDLAVSTNGTIAFATEVTSGAAYAVSVKTQPSVLSQTCTVAGGSGTATNADISVTVACVTNSYAIGGTVSGLSGSGLTLQDNGTDPLSITASGTFKFAHPVLSGAAFSVSVATQPVNPAQTCSVADGSGSVTSAAVSTVVVTCVTVTKNFTIGGTISGLVAAGSGLLLRDISAANPVDDVTIGGNGNGSFTFPTALAGGAAYNVIIVVQPNFPAQACTINGGTGTVANANVTNVVVTCAPPCASTNGTVVQHANNIVADETWAGAGTVHIVESTISVMAPATLTIQKCATVRLKAGVQIIVEGGANAGSVATLLAAGDDPATGLVYFANNDANQPWGSLEGYNANSHIQLNYVSIAGGGATTASTRNATIEMHGTSSSTIPDPVLKVNDVSISAMQGTGVYLDNAAFTPDSVSLYISNSPDYAMAMSAMALGSIPPYLGAANAHDEALVVGNANIFADLTIHKRLPIHFHTAGVKVAGGPPSFAPIVTLTLDPGVVFRFENVSGTPTMMTFGTNGQTQDQNGVLIANGNQYDPIIFTSGLDSPPTLASDYWAGIWLLTSNGSQLQNVVFEYAGGDANVGPVNCGPFDPSINQQARHTAPLLVGDGTDQQYIPPANLITGSVFRNNIGNFAIDSVWENSTRTFGPNLHNDNVFTSPGQFCPQSKNLIPLGCTISGVDESGCLP